MVVKEYTAFKFNKTVVRHSLWKIGFQCSFDEEQVIMLEVAERAKMEEQQYCKDLAVRQGSLTSSALYTILAQKQLSCIFRFKMFAKLVNGTK